MCPDAAGIGPAASGQSSRSRVQLGTVPAGVLSRPQRHRRLLSAAGQDRAGRYARTATVLLRAPANVNDAGQVSMLCVPETSSTSCDQAVFVGQATDASPSSDAVLLKIGRFG